MDLDSRMHGRILMHLELFWFTLIHSTSTESQMNEEEILCSSVSAPQHGCLLCDTHSALSPPFPDGMWLGAGNISQSAHKKINKSLARSIMKPLKTPSTHVSTHTDSQLLRNIQYDSVLKFSKNIKMIQNEKNKSIQIISEQESQVHTQTDHVVLNFGGNIFSPPRKTKRPRK